MHNGFVGIGLTIGGMIYAFDHVSGAHFNPAVTLGVVLNGKMRVGTALLYVIAQVLGALVGTLLSAAIADPTNIPPLLPSSSAPFGSIGSAFAVEFLFTCALVLVQQNAAMEKNGREPNSYFGMAVCVTVLAGAAAVQPISGGCFNPAVGFALDFVSLVNDNNDSFRNQWIYWVGPLGGAVAATGLKRYMNLQVHQETEGLPLVVPLTEFLGTFFLTLTATLTGNAVAVGSMLIAMVYMGDHVCGADYNPAVTVGVALRMAVPWRELWKVAVTVIAQFVGAICAALLAYGVSGSIQYPSNSIPHGQAGPTIFEALWTALLVYVVCAVMTPTHGEDDPNIAEERRGHSRSFQGMAIGFIVIGGIMCGASGGGASGGVFNPALGTAIVAVNNWFLGKSASDMWIFIAGPFIGSVLGAGAFTLLHFHRDPMLEYDQLEQPSFY